MPDQAFISWVEVIYGNDMFLRDDQDVDRSSRTDIPECHRAVIPIDDFPRGGPVNNAAKDAIGWQYPSFDLV